MSTEKRIHDLIKAYFDLDNDQTELIQDEFKRVVLPGGQWLFRQGDPGDALFFLVRGRLQVWADSADADSAGEPVLLGEVMPNETVGEISLLTGQQRSAGIRAGRDSLLLKVDRAAFERLTTRHPQMTLKLAGSIATRLQRRTSGTTSSARRLVNICLLPLGDSERSQDFSKRLTTELASSESTLALNPGCLGESGAPVAALGPESPIPQELVAWIDEQQDRHRFVIHQCESVDNAWTRFAIRQADMVLLIADGTQDPGLRNWESILEAGDGVRMARHVLIMLHPSASISEGLVGQWLAPRTVDFHLHSRENNPNDLARIGRVLSGRALGLVLGAGAARGFAHIGVYRALCEAGVTVDWVGGSSIGAILGAGIAKEWTPDELSASAFDGFVTNKPFSDYTVPVISFLSGKRMMRATERLLPGLIEDLPIPFFCPSSNLDNGVVNVHESGPLPEAIQATAALPGALPPAVVNRHLAVDGAVLNSLPVDIMRARPVGEIIAVNLTSRKTYEVDYEQMPTAWQILKGRWFPWARKFRVPSLVTVLLKSTEIGTAGRVTELGAMADCLLSPQVRKFGMTQVKAFDAIVEAGYTNARELLPAWLEQRQNAGGETVEREMPESLAEVVDR